MKQIVIVISLLMATICAKAQDMIYLHNGTTVTGTVQKEDAYTITYVNKGETVSQVMSRYAIEKIVYASGRTEKVTDKIIVNGKGDWEKVVILDDKSATTGLLRVDDIVSSAGHAFMSPAKIREKAIESTKKAAAELGCPFVFITKNTPNNWSSAKYINEGVAFKY